MAQLDERARHELYERLQLAVGEDATETLMSLLPPVGWADVATKQDLDSVGHRIENGLRAEMAANHRQLLFAMLGTLLTTMGIVISLLLTIA